MRLSQKQLSSVGVWLRQVETWSKDILHQMLFDDFIHVANQCVYTFAYQKPILNYTCKKGK